MSIVPLNFGAAAPFKLKLHFTHVSAAGSSLLVPQFGQYNRHLSFVAHVVAGSKAPSLHGTTARSILPKITRAQGERLP
jgi:hypothetical protein